MAQTMETRRNGAARTALKSRANDVLDDVAELRKDVSKLAGAAGKAARNEMKTARDKINRLTSDLRTRAGDSAEYVSEQVRTHPGAAIGVSLGAGLLIGLLLSRR